MCSVVQLKFGFYTLNYTRTELKMQQALFGLILTRLNVDFLSVHSQLIVFRLKHTALLFYFDVFNPVFRSYRSLWMQLSRFHNQSLKA